MVLSAFSLVVALAFSFLARADVIPSEPSPGAIYNEGQQCTLSWAGDPDKSDAWKSMNIALMTGDNFNMIQLMAIGTTFDGSIDGRFSYPCPDVTINSAIYFYQFTSPQASDKAWTTRFTIAGPNGETTPPANAVQPNSGDKIPWGVGGLAGSSQSMSASAGVASPSLSASVESPAIANTQPSSPAAVATVFNTVTPSPATAPATTRLAVMGSSTSQSSPSTTPPNTDAQTDGSVRTSTASAMMALILPVIALALL